MVVFAGREHDGEPHEHAPQHEGWHPYGMFAVNMLLSLVVMDLVMLSMIDGWGDFRNNLSMFYMALTMVAPWESSCEACTAARRSKRLGAM